MSDPLGGGSDWDSEFGGGGDHGVLFGLRHCLVRADREVVELDRCGPLAQRLGQQREEGDEHEHPLGSELLREERRDKGLARPAIGSMQRLQALSEAFENAWVAADDRLASPDDPRSEPTPVSPPHCSQPNGTNDPPSAF